MTRLILAWFLVAFATMAAAPALQDPAKGLTQLCRATGMTWVKVSTDGQISLPSDERSASHLLPDCPLCGGHAHTSTALTLSLSPSSATSHPVAQPSAAPWQRLTAPPLPSRGPPPLA